MFRNRLPMILDRVTTITTPGKDIDVVVTQGGVAVNPKNVELRERLVAGGLPVIDIHDLQAKAERITGKPQPVRHGDKVVAEVIYRDGSIIDRIYNTL
jgi:citrate lyase subunit alpha/citrate CoA-transferase